MMHFAIARIISLMLKELIQAMIGSKNKNHLPRITPTIKLITIIKTPIEVLINPFNPPTSSFTLLHLVASGNQYDN